MKNRPVPLVLFLLIILTLCGVLPAQAFRYAVMPDNPRPGEPVTIGVRYAAGARQAALVLEGKRLSRAAFFAVPAEDGKQAFMAAVLTVPSTAQPGRAFIAIEGAAGTAGEIAITIAAREFISEVIVLDAALTRLRTVPDPHKTAEAEQLWAILGQTGTETYGFGNFSPPVTSTRRTGFFGDRRRFQYSDGQYDSSIHAGVDFGVPTGTAVSACGPGRVVLARNRIVTGNSVIIEHLPGIYSLYYHLDSIAVSEGSLVDAGTGLGLSGTTGLSTGPHLHWELRVFGENTDPDAFIARPILDKDAILCKLYQ
jgi:murein DD-endopeptidase MepM/ murein hydrolase activator NlpD